MEININRQNVKASVFKVNENEKTQIGIQLSISQLKKAKKEKEIKLFYLVNTTSSLIAIVENELPYPDQLVYAAFLSTSGIQKG